MDAHYWLLYCRYYDSHFFQVVGVVKIDGSRSAPNESDRINDDSKF